MNMRDEYIYLGKEACITHAKEGLLKLKEEVCSVGYSDYGAYGLEPLGYGDYHYMELGYDDVFEVLSKTFNLSSEIFLKVDPGNILTQLDDSITLCYPIGCNEKLINSKFWNSMRNDIKNGIDLFFNSYIDHYVTEESEDACWYTLSNYFNYTKCDTYTLLISTAYNKFNKYLKKYCSKRTDIIDSYYMSYDDCKIFIGEECLNGDCMEAMGFVNNIEKLFSKGFADSFQGFAEDRSSGLSDWQLKCMTYYVDPAIKYIKAILDGLSKKRPNVIVENVMVLCTESEFMGVLPAVNPYVNYDYGIIPPYLNKEYKDLDIFDREGEKGVAIDSFDEEDGLHIGIVLGIDLNKK